MKGSEQKRNGRFFDINRFPPQKGMLVFGVSMSRIANTQDAKHNWDHVKRLVEKIKQSEGVGLVTLYTEFLYLHSSEKAHGLRNDLLGKMLEHQKRFQGSIKSNPWFIQNSFSFLTWSQAILNCEIPFLDALRKVESLYKRDAFFRRCVQSDIKQSGRKPSDRNAAKFVLEESVLQQFFQKGLVRIPNDFINHHERWILMCYPGKPLRTEVYLGQKNPLKLKNPQNRFENSFYDLEKRILYNYKDVDLEKDWALFE